MKKKVLAVSFVFALLAIALVGGSLAYFMDTDQAVNTFTIGSVKIEQMEQQRGEEDGKSILVDYVNEDKMLLPVVGDPITSERDEFGLPIGVSNYQDKVVSVKNTGKNEAYVRTFIAVPVSDVEGFDVPIPVVTTDTMKAAENGWTLAGNYYQEIDGIKYWILYYDHTDSVVAGSETKSVLSGVYLPSAMNLNVVSDTEAYFVMELDSDGDGIKEKYELKDFNAYDKIEILVVTQAVQEEGFSDVASALTAGFGTPSATNSPFTNTVTQ